MDFKASHHLNREVEKFNQLAYAWWDLEGEFKTLHHINPTRVEFILKHINKLNDKLILDVGCGGGILSESLAKGGAKVTGIDLAPSSIEVAKLHLYESGLNIDYKCLDLGQLSAEYSLEQFDIVVCMEMLEHVDDPLTIISQIAKLLKPNGLAFFSTLNRTFKSYLFGVLIAEYMFKLLPKNTHEFKKFIKPSELRQMLSLHNLHLINLQGIDYNPLTKVGKLTQNLDINYIVCCQKF
jgi:2-polyprenyl-6-hydroxyphenyl methylase/3-demethylubiquinone-9 3-methyltransferase